MQTLGKDRFTKCQTLGEQRRSAKYRQQLTTVIFAERQTLTLGKAYFVEYLT
jgi:hypothetical protein